MKWFKHDSDANMDGKLQEVLLDYGLEGYGLYWYCIEMITSKVSKDNLTFELEHDSRIIARNTGSSVQRVQEMMTRFVELGLFDNDNGNIRCLKLLKRLDSSMTNNKEMRQLIQTAKTNHDPVMTQSDNVMLEENRIEQNRTEQNRTEQKVISPAKDAEPAEFVSVFTFPTKSGDWELSTDLFNQHEKAYPCIDLMAEYNKILLWLNTNTRSKKTKTGMPAFLTRWLNKANPNQPQPTNVPIQQIVDEYNRILAPALSYRIELISPQLTNALIKRWEGSVNAQRVEWWRDIFGKLRANLDYLEPRFYPKRYRLDEFAGFEFEKVINELQSS
jgi:hypothetical protein